MGVPAAQPPWHTGHDIPGYDTSPMTVFGMTCAAFGNPRNLLVTRLRRTRVRQESATLNAAAGSGTPSDQVG